MSDRRLKPTTEIHSRDQFERVIDQIVLRQLAKERLELSRDAAILKIREQCDPDITDLSEQMQAELLRAEKYAQDHRDELLPTRAKTAETKFASFGFRLGNPTLVLLNRKWTWASVVKAIKTLHADWLKYVIVRESVNKEALKLGNAAQLASIGTRIEQKESFFIEPKRDPADHQRLVSEAKVAA